MTPWSLQQPLLRTTAPHLFNRITLIEDRQFLALFKEHLGMDVLISLAKPPKGWTLADTGQTTDTETTVSAD